MRREIYRELSRCLQSDRLVALATVVSDPGRGKQLLLEAGGLRLGDLGYLNLNERVLARARDLLARFHSEKCTIDLDGRNVEVFIEIHPPRPQLILMGAVQVAIPLVSFAKSLGFRTVVVDPRAAFATPDRFAHADVLMVEWPEAAFDKLDLNEATYVAALSHDPKLDLPALRLALKSPVRYIGLLGSKKTRAKRMAVLEEEGFSSEEIARIHSPIGLALGGRGAEEIAVSIIAEIVAVSHGIPCRSPA